MIVLPDLFLRNTNVKISARELLVRKELGKDKEDLDEEDSVVDKNKTQYTGLRRKY